MVNKRDGNRTHPKHTLHAHAKTHAAASSMPSASAAKSNTALSHAVAFILRKNDPQTSAIALCISGEHFRSVADTAFHVSSSSSGFTDGTSKNLKRADSVSNSAVSTVALIEGRNSLRRRLRRSGYTGDRVVRRP